MGVCGDGEHEDESVEDIDERGNTGNEKDDDENAGAVMLHDKDHMKAGESFPHTLLATCPSQTRALFYKYFLCHVE